MNKEFEYRGYWSLPSNKDVVVFGILTYKPFHKITFEAYGNFDNDFFTKGLKNEDIILGLTSESKKITLLGCYMTKSSGVHLIQGEPSGVAPNTYTIHYVFEGEHIENTDDFKFNKVVSTIHNLDEWVGVSGFTQSLDDLDFKEFEIKTRYKLPEPIKFDISDNLEGQFNFTAKPPTVSRYQKEVVIKQNVEFILSSNTEIDFRDFLARLFEFQNLLVLALYSNTHTTSVSFYGDNFTKQFPNEKPHRKRINLYFNSGDGISDREPKLDLEMLFSYQAIKLKFPAIIKEWYTKYDILRPAFNLLFEQFYSDGTFTENSFLNLAQAAETFHARVNNHTKMPKKEYEQMKRDIMEVAPNKYHAWLNEQFSFGNNLNLEQRLREIVARYSNNAIDKIIGDKEKFVKQVKWSRNYYTHYSESGKKNALEGSDLFYLSEKLKILLVCAFLMEIGFDKNEIEEQMDWLKFKLFSHLADWKT